jgi:hypothetical protein
MNDKILKVIDQIDVGVGVEIEQPQKSIASKQWLEPESNGGWCLL